MNRIGVRQPSDLTRTVNTIKQQVGDKIIQVLEHLNNQHRKRVTEKNE